MELKLTYERNDRGCRGGGVNCL